MEKDNKVGNIIITLIVLAVIVAAVYCGYKFLFNVDENSSNLNPVKIEDVGKEKFSFLYSKHNVYNNDFIFFKNNDVNINNIDNQDVLMTLYTMLSKEDKNRSGEANNECFLDKGNYTKDNYPSTCYKETFDKSILEEQFNNYFSPNLKVKYTNFLSSGNQECYIDNSTYNCYLKRNNVSIREYVTVMDYDYSILNDDKLEIYSYLLTIRSSKYNNYLEGIYSDSEATKYIDNLSYYNTELNGIIDSSTTKRIIEKYRSKISKYKSTFIKNNKNYVWVSTELVK